MAGAVLRPKGSRTVARGVMRSWRSCSATRNRCASLQTMTGAAAASPSRRSTVCCSNVRVPMSGKSCLGYSSRDSGHSRVPAPPERMTGVSTPCDLAASGRRDQLAAADGVVAEPEAVHHRRIVEIAAIEYDRCLQQLPQPLEIRATELLPLGDDGECIRPARGLIRVLRQCEPSNTGVEALRLGTRHRVVSVHAGARLEEQL